MTFVVEDIQDRIVSLLLASGYFDRVNTSEPKSAPGSGLTAAVWLGPVAPAVGASGLSATSIRLEWRIRLYMPFLRDPDDLIELDMLRAEAYVLGAFTGDFDLGGSVRNVDLLGAHGTPLSGQPGYLNQSGVNFRIVDLFVPLICNDVWSQLP